VLTYLEVIFLPGLFFIEIDYEGHFGFIITFDKKHYKEVTLYFQTREERDKWMVRICKEAKFRDFSHYYEEGHAIGHGKFSHVFAGKCLSTQEQVAIKKIDKTLIDPSELLFLREELNIINLIGHPNVAEMRDIFENRKYIFIVLELGT